MGLVSLAKLAHLPITQFPSFFFFLFLPSNSRAVSGRQTLVLVHSAQQGADPVAQGCTAQPVADSIGVALLQTHCIYGLISSLLPCPRYPPQPRPFKSHQAVRASSAHATSCDKHTAGSKYPFFQSTKVFPNHDFLSGSAGCCPFVIFSSVTPDPLFTSTPQAKQDSCDSVLQRRARDGGNSEGLQGLRSHRGMLLPCTASRSNAQ